MTESPPCTLSKRIPACFHFVDEEPSRSTRRVLAGMKHLESLLSKITDEESASLIRAISSELQRPLQAQIISREDFNGSITKSSFSMIDRLTTAAFTSSQSMSEESPMALLFRGILRVPGSESKLLRLRMQLKAGDNVSSKIILTDNDTGRR